MGDQAELPEISDVQRLTIKPGDSLVVRSPARLSREEAELIVEHMRAVLRLSVDVPVLVLPSGMAVEVVQEG